MIRKKPFENFSTYLLAFCILGYTLPSSASDTDEMDMFNDQDIMNLIPTLDVPITRAATAPLIAELLIDVGAATILQQEIFCHTNPLNHRQLLDLPIFWQPRKLTPYCWNLGTHIFYNQTKRGYFTCNSSSVSSYLAINSPELLASLEPTAQKFLSDFTLDPAAVLPLFKDMTVEERRAGLMMHGDRQCGRVYFSFFAPLYYLENNFILSEKEIEAVEDALGETNKDDALTFARKHMISDEFGLGDIRLIINFLVMNYQHFNLRFGFFSTLPTAVAFQKGLVGSHFKRRCDRPEFDFAKLFDLGNSGNAQQRDQAANIAGNFTLGGLDNLAAMLLQSELGNGSKYPTLGICFHPTTALSKFLSRPWAQSVFFKSNLTIEYLFPSDQLRSFVQTHAQNKADFAQLGLNDDPAEIVARAKADAAYAQNVVSFLQGKFIDQLYPFAFCTKVHPGFIFHWSSTAFVESDRWGGLLGTDNWVQSQEKLSNVCIVKTSDGRPHNIDIGKAIRPLAYQLKVVASAFYKVKRPTTSWAISLQFDDTVISTGIGKDFSVSLNFEANF